MAVEDASGLSPVVVNCWLPKDALPVPAEGEEAPARKSLAELLSVIPARLKASAPLAIIKELEGPVADAQAKKEAGEITEEEYDMAAEEKLTAAKAAYDELAVALCKEPYTTVEWIDSIMGYVGAGCTTIIPGGVLTDSDNFGVNAKPLAATTRVLGEFVKQSKLEKGEGASCVMPVYAPNVFQSYDAATDAAAWVDATCARLGVETLEHVLVRWWDDAVHIGDCMKALKATEKVGKISLGKASKKSLTDAHLAGVTPAAIVLPALVALTPACAAVVKDAKVLKVGVCASNALLGGFVAEKYIGRPCPEMAELVGTPLFQGLAAIEKSGGWDKFQAVLKALKATGRGVESAMVQLFVDAGMHAVVETELSGAPAFTVSEPLPEDAAKAIVAAMS